ncbi:MAG: hypothetical protein CM15mP12_3950 [Gammaproteobacteria bacterium]|nr:MAG: hypothetical protein CM15mP12_3950 [Gammaproteobacteria bacterium]
MMVKHFQHLEKRVKTLTQDSCAFFERTQLLLIRWSCKWADEGINISKALADKDFFKIAKSGEILTTEQWLILHSGIS